jgi:hypothetical protein
MSAAVFAQLVVFSRVVVLVRLAAVVVWALCKRQEETVVARRDAAQH